MAAKIRKGDRIVVLSGKDKGREGTVIAIDPKTGKATVEGINVARKSQRPVNEVKVGGIIDVNMPLPMSKLAVLSPKDGKATRVGFKVNADGTKVRVCKRTGAEFK